jgi:hypothetical protein
VLWVPFPPASRFPSGSGQELALLIISNVALVVSRIHCEGSDGGEGLASGEVKLLVMRSHRLSCVVQLELT